MKNRLTFAFGFLALASVLALCGGGGKEVEGIASRYTVAGTDAGHGIAPAPKQIADGQETHGFKPKNA